MYSQTFAITGNPRILFPGAYLSAAGRVVLATGRIKRIMVAQVAGIVLVGTIGVYDAHDANGETFRSTGRVKREIDVTSATAIRQSVFEVYGNAITGGPALSTYNKRAEFKTEEKQDGFGGYWVPETWIDLDVDCLHGMIVNVAGINNGATVSVQYEPRTLGKAWWDRANSPVAVF